MSLGWNRKKYFLLIPKVVLFLLYVKYNYVNEGKGMGNVLWK